MNPIVITSGEPAGIGPDLCAMLAAESFAADIVVLGDGELIQERAALRGLDISRLKIENVPLPVRAEAGQLNPQNSAYVLKLLDLAVAGCQSGEFAAMVTAPVHKGIINQAALPSGHFSGHTEYLAERTGTPCVVMMLVGGNPMMRVALATTHLPLKDVAGAINAEMLLKTLHILHADLVNKFGLPAPRILVAGLNPHAGEGGYLGREEIDIIAPVIESLKAKGMKLTGPLPADTLFTPQMLAGADAVLAMYHDQGLPVLKHASFGAGVNVTLGLPIIRTSVDHGTALDLAGSGNIDAGSLRQAVAMAIELAARAA